jgi:S1-C subfamily serine protease
MRRGDILVKLGKYDIGGVEDLMFVLNSVKPGETVNAVVLRDGKPLTLEATFQEGRRAR